MIILRWKVNSEETQIQHPLLPLFTSTVLSSRRKHIQACKRERGTWSQNVNSIWVCIVFTIHILSCPRIYLKQQRRALCRKSSPPHCKQPNQHQFFYLNLNTVKHSDLKATKCDESNTPFGTPPRPIVGQSTIKRIKCHPNRPLRLTTILRSCQNVSCRARNQCGSERTGTLEKHRHGNGILRVPPNPTNLVLNNAK